MTTALAPAPAPAKAPAGIEPSIPNKVRAAFAFLPEQATGAPKLADFFIEIGIQGRRNDKLFCPVASYLRAVTGNGNIRVGTLTTTVKTPNGSVTIQNPVLGTGPALPSRRRAGRPCTTGSTCRPS